MDNISTKEVEDAVKSIPFSVFKKEYLNQPAFENIAQQQSQYSKEYLEFSKTTKLPPMTNTQVKFAQWLLLPESTAQLEKIGDLESVFKAVRRYIKTQMGRTPKMKMETLQ